MSGTTDFDKVRPSKEEVAALLFSRLKHEGGLTVAVWDDNTEPTVTQVDSIIDQATGQLLDRVGVPIKDTQVARGKWLATVYSAALIAQEYTPEQRGESAAYTGLIGEYAVQIVDFIDANRLPYTISLG